MADSLYAAAPLALSQNDLVAKTVSSHPFNQRIQILLPVKLQATNRLHHASCSNFDAMDLIKTHLPLIHSFIDGSFDPSRFRYCRATSVPLHYLVHPKIIKSFLHKGLLLVTSIENSIDIDDGICLTSQGMLILSVTERTYRKLGLEGRESVLNRRKNATKKFIIELDLHSNCIQNTMSKFSKRLRRLFRDSAVVFDLLFKWQPNDQCDSIESIAKFLQQLKSDPDETLPEQEAQIKIEVCNLNVRGYKNSLSRLPKTLSSLSTSAVSEIEERLNLILEDAIDWTGLQLTQCEVVREESTSDLSTYGFNPDICDPLSYVTCLELTGFFSPSEVEDILSEIDCKVEHLSNHLPCIGILVHGFNNCVISWMGKGNEHGKYLSGENLYGVLMTAEASDVQVPEKTECPIVQSSATDVQVVNNVLKKGLIWRVSDSYDFSLEKL